MLRTYTIKWNERLSSFPGDNLLLEYDWAETFEAIMAMDTGKDAAKAARSVITAETPKKLTEYQQDKILDDAYGIIFAELGALQDMLTKFRNNRRFSLMKTRSELPVEVLTMAWEELGDSMEYFFEVTEEFEDGR